MELVRKNYDKKYIMECPSCKNEITSDDHFICESEINGWDNIGYICDLCDTRVYTSKIEKCRDKNDELIYDYSDSRNVLLQLKTRLNGVLFDYQCLGRREYETENYTDLRIATYGKATDEVQKEIDDLLYKIQTVKK